MQRFLTMILAAAMLLSIPSVAFSGTVAAATKTARGANHLMCSGLQVINDTCDDADNSTTEIYAVVDTYDSVTFTLYDVGGTSSCDVYAAGPEANVPGSADLMAITDPYTAHSVKVNATALTVTAPKLTLSGFDFKYMWISCTAVGTTTRVYMNGSFGRQRW